MTAKQLRDWLGSNPDDDSLVILVDADGWSILDVTVSFDANKDRVVLSSDYQDREPEQL